MEKEQIEHCCGNCCWFKFEDIDGDGMCMRNYHDEEKGCVNCGDGEKCRKFISNEEKREILKKLKQWKKGIKSERVFLPRQAHMRRHSAFWALLSD